MDAARLNEKIVIKSQTFTNSFGDMVASENVLTTTMATRSAKTISTEDGVIAEVVNFYLRYFAGIDYNSIIYWKDIKHKIVSINVVGRNEAISINTIRIENQ